MSLIFVPEYDFVRGLGHMPGVPRLDIPLVGAMPTAASPTAFSHLEVFPERFAKTRKDQRRTNSCSGQMGASLAQDRHVKATGQWAELSELFLYNRARSRRGWLGQDSGAIISDVFDVLATEGVPLKGFMPFDEALIRSEPFADAVAQAARHKLTRKQVPRNEAVIQSILSGGGDPSLAAPVGIGVIVYQHRWYAPDVVRTGWIDVPSKTTDLAGWHAIKLIGYDALRDTYDIENWWSDTWASQSVVGKPGFGRIAGQYIRDPRMSSDFVTADQYTVTGDEA